MNEDLKILVEKETAGERARRAARGTAVASMACRRLIGCMPSTPGVPSSPGAAVKPVTDFNFEHNNSFYELVDGDEEVKDSVRVLNLLEERIR